jgi:hypothetical protein
MSIIEKLTEGIVNRDMKQEGEALLNKWSATGLLEGLENEQMKHTMSRLLENQAKDLLREASGMGRGDVDGFAAVAFPIVRRVFAGLIANDLVSVQPMSLPSGLIFFLDFVYGDTLGTSAQADIVRFGNEMGDTATPTTNSIYGGGRVGSAITGGVNLVGATNKENLGGPRQMVGYAYASPTGSNNDALNQAHITVNAAFKLDGAVSEANAKLIQFDPDLLAITDSSVGVVVCELDEAELANADGVASMDFDNLSAFVLSATALTTMDAVIDAAGANFTSQIRRLTSRVAAASSGTGNNALRVVLTLPGGNTTAGDTAVSSTTLFAANQFQYPVADEAESSATSAGALTSFTMPLELNENIPEIDIKVDSIAITAQTKKLKAKWSPELGQDLNAYHNLDAEVELTSILSEQIALEIDREILADLVNGATAAVYYWSRSPGLFVNRITGEELGATSAAPDFTGTVSEWYETLIETINDVSAQIHLKTLRGGANFVVCSPEVANILEFTSGFRANVTADADKGDIGAVKAGNLNRKFDVIVDPYFPRNIVLVGRRGNSFLESGYVYAPYVPLQTTPTIFGVEDFVPRKGVMTRYAKKMVRPDMYGLVICRGLIGESGAVS